MAAGLCSAIGGCATSVSVSGRALLPWRGEVRVQSAEAESAGAPFFVLAATDGQGESQLRPQERKAIFKR